MTHTWRIALTIVVVVAACGAGALGLGIVPGHPAAHAAPAAAPLQQGVQATGLLTVGQGTCFPDAVLLDCSGNVSRQLKGPGGSGFFAPYMGQWVTLDGAEMTCVVGDKYIQVVNISIVSNPCGTVTATPPPTPTPIPGAATATPLPPTPGPSPTPGASNMALTRQVWVSSEPDAAHPGIHAVDGDANTWWASVPDPYTVWDVRHVQWIYVDLGSDQQVKSMRMLWSDQNRPRVYSVYVWHDRYQSWMLLASTRAGLVDDKPAFPYPVPGRYFMLWLEVPNLVGSNYELKQWEILGEAQAAVQSTNVAGGKASIALSSEVGYEAGKGTDGNTATEWRSSAGLPAWFYTDLGTAYDINKVTLRWTPGMHATGYTLYAWDSYWSRWNAVYTTTSGAGGDETVTFNTTRTRYVLVHATAGPAPNVGLRELEVYEYRSSTLPRPFAAGGAWAVPDGSTTSKTADERLDPGRWLAPDGTGGAPAPGTGTMTD